MICQHEDELICDLAETYHILDFKALQPSLVAVLLLGLRENSRVKMAYSDSMMDVQTLLLSSVVDRLSILIWHNTEDGRNGNNPPKLIVNQESEKEYEEFNTPKDFHSKWNRLTGE